MPPPRKEEANNRVKVSLTTEDGEVLDQFIITERGTYESIGMFATELRNVLELRYETEDVS